MKLRVVASSGRLLRRLRSADSMLREAAVDAAAEALRDEVQRGGESTILIAGHGPRRAVGSAEAGAAARELGTLDLIPSPWLAPVLPLALEPMRAAANAAAARAFSRFGRKKK